MAATMERLEEYRTHNAQFCKRMLDFLTIMFTAQTSLLLKGGDGIELRNDKPVIVSHSDLEGYLGRYCGLMLYLKEMEEIKYSKVCAVSVHPSGMCTSISIITFVILPGVLLGRERTSRKADKGPDVTI